MYENYLVGQNKINQLNQNVCFCTLALGRKYRLLAIQLAGDLLKFSPTHTLLILTDDVSDFKNSKNIMAFKHQKKSVLGYNDKLCVVQKALELFETCIFIDADVRILAPVNLTEEIFKPGLKAFRIRTWKYVIEEAKSFETMPWKKENLRIINLLKKQYSLPLDIDNFPFVCEFLFAITKTPQLDTFLKTWNNLAVFCERNHFFIHEGFSIGLASIKSGFLIQQVTFNGLNFFDPIISVQDIESGKLSQADFNALNATINQYKKNQYSQNRYVRKILSKIDLLLKRIKQELQFIKISLFCLNFLK